MGARGRRSTPTRRSPTARAGWSGSGGSPTSRAPPTDDRRRPPRDDVRRLRRLQADGGDGLGGRPVRLGRCRRALPRADRDHRPGAGGRRLPQHGVRAARPARRDTATSSGATSCTTTATCCRRRWPGRARRAPTSSSTSPGASPTTCATRSADGGIERVGGHPEIELGLVELARADRRAALPRPGGAVRRAARHGARSARSRFGQAYFQDDVPIREATVFRGHAVRAMYLAAGAVDVAVETGDDELLAVADRPVGGDDRPPHVPHRRDGLARTPARRSATTSCCRPDRAYSETCAGIGSVMLAWRLLLATGETALRRSHRAHAVQRRGHVAGAGRPALLLRQPAPPARARARCPSDDVESKRASSSLREPWFLVACCPTNVARTLASLAAYLATADDGGIQIHQYADSRIAHDARRRPPGRRRGRDRLSRRRHRRRCGSPRPTGSRGRSRCGSRRGRRVPSSTDADGRRPVAPGTVVVERPFAVGDEVTLTLPMAPRWTLPDPRIDAVRGCVAVERGPLVMCAESVDLPGERHVDVLRVDPSVPPAERRRHGRRRRPVPRPGRRRVAVRRRRRRRRRRTRRTPSTSRSCRTTAGPTAARRRCASGSPPSDRVRPSVSGRSECFVPDRSPPGTPMRQTLGWSAVGGGFLEAVADGVAEADRRGQHGDDVGAAVGVGVA